MISMQFAQIGCQLIVMMIVSIVLAAVVGVLIYHWYSQWNHLNLPPRMLSLPFIGNTYLLRQDRQKVFMEISRKLKSSVIRFTMGSQDIYVINDHDPVLEVLRKQTGAFGARDLRYFPLGKPGCGIIFTDGDNWALHRNIALRCIKDHSGGLESHLQEQAESLCQELQQSSGPINPMLKICYSISMVIARCLFETYNPTDVHEYIDAALNMANCAKKAGLATMIPPLKYLPGDPFKFKRFMHFIVLRQQILKRLIDVEKERFNKGEYNSSLVSEYLQSMAQPNADPLLNDERLTHSVKEMLFASVETTKSAISWAIWFMVSKPEIQEKVREEILSEIGDRTVCSKDTGNLPYTMSVMTEVHRLGSVATFAPMLLTTEETQLCGYTIPKDSSVLVNLSSVHWDEKTYSEPFEFRPERFLQSDGSGRLEFVKRPDFVPFGAGTRNCLGKPLAQMVFFTIFVTMIQRLRLSCEHLPDKPPQLDLTWHPPEFCCNITAV